MKKDKSCRCTCHGFMFVCGQLPVEITCGHCKEKLSQDIMAEQFKKPKDPILDAHHCPNNDGQVCECFQEGRKAERRGCSCETCRFGTLKKDCQCFPMSCPDCLKIRTQKPQDQEWGETKSEMEGDCLTKWIKDWNVEGIVDGVGGAGMQFLALAGRGAGNGVGVEEFKKYKEVATQEIKRRLTQAKKQEQKKLSDKLTAIDIQLKHLMDAVMGAQYGTKNRSELISRLQDIYNLLHEQSLNQKDV